MHAISCFVTLDASCFEQISQIIRVKKVRYAFSILQTPEVVVVAELRREANKRPRGVGCEGQPRQLVFGDLQKAGRKIQNPLHIEQGRAFACACH